MARLDWNVAGTRFYEAGVDRGVLYIGTSVGVPWTGLIGVDENPNGGEARPYYIDGMKYLNLSNAEEFEGSIRAYTYPVEFAQCDGTARIRSGLFFGQQQRKSFGFSYRTVVGNDIEGTAHGYKIHLVYNALATPTSKSVSSYSDSVEASEFSWDLSTKSRAVSGVNPTAHIIVDSRYTHPITLASIEDILYGSDSTVSRLPTPEELIAIFDIPVEWEVDDNGDGTFRVAGPEENVRDIGLGFVVIEHPDVTVIDADSYSITY